LELVGTALARMEPMAGCLADAGAVLAIKVNVVKLNAEYTNVEID
jgi:hypothetical protein